MDQIANEPATMKGILVPGIKRSVVESLKSGCRVETRMRMVLVATGKGETVEVVGKCAATKELLIVHDTSAGRCCWYIFKLEILNQ